MSRESYANHDLHLGTLAAYMKLPAGVQGNDVLGAFPAMLLMIIVVYVYTHRVELMGDYFQSRFEATPEKDKPDTQIAAQISLRYPQDASNLFTSYNLTSEPEKVARERAFVKFMREINSLDINSNLAAHLKTTLVSRADSATPQIQNVQDVPNATCRDSTQTSWWLARYELDSLYENQPPVTKYLPVSFYLEGTKPDGSRVILYGPVKRMDIYVDKNVMLAPSDSLSYKIYFELVNANWTLDSGIPLQNQVFKLFAQQTSDKCGFSALVDDEGRAHNLYISNFAFRMSERPVSITENVMANYRQEGLFDTVNLTQPLQHGGLATVRFSGNRDQAVSFLIRSLPLQDGTIVWSIDEEQHTLRMGGVTPQTRLPLEVHMRSEEGLDDNKTRTMIMPVMSVTVRYITKPKPPGTGMRDPAYIKAIQFVLMDGKTLAQDASEKTRWFMDTRLLPKDTSIDLVAFSRLPPAGHTADLVQIRKNGVVEFYNFRGVRVGMFNSSLSADEQMRIRYDRPRQQFEDTRVHDDDIPFSLESWVTWPVRIVVLLLAAATALGWRFPNRALAMTLVNVSSILVVLVGFAYMLFAYLELTERLEGVPFSYERPLYIGVGIAYFFVILAMMFTVRFIPETPWSLLFGLKFGLIGGAIVLLLEQENNYEAPLPENVLTIKLTGAVVAMLGLFLTVNETFKYYRKLSGYQHFHSPPLGGIMFMDNPSTFGIAMTGLFFVCFSFVFTFGFYHPPDECLRLKHRLKVAEESQRADPENLFFAQDVEYYRTRLNLCENTGILPDTVREWFYGALENKRVGMVLGPVLLLLPVVLVKMSAHRVALFYQKRKAFFNERSVYAMEKVDEGGSLVESQADTRVAMIVKAALGLVIIYLTVQSYLEVSEIRPGACTFFREMEYRNEEAINNSANIGLDEEEWMDMIYDAQSRRNCTSRATPSLLGFMVLVYVIVVLTLTAPGLVKPVPGRSSVFRAFGIFVGTSLAATLFARFVEPGVPERILMQGYSNLL